jgi:hypothetical protein
MDKDVPSLLRDAVAEVLEEVRRVPAPGTAHQVVTLHHGDRPPMPPTPWHLWLCGGFCVACALLTWFSLETASDAKAQGRADRQELLDEIRALKDDTKGIRAYINTGRLQPLPERKKDAQ